MGRRVRVAESSRWDERDRASVDIGGREITVVRGDGGFFALWNRCPHANGRVGDGEVHGTTIVCPLHRWKFDLRTGATPRDRRLKATIYPVEVVDGVVFVIVPDEG